MAAAEPDHRAEHRKRVLKGGAILLGINQSEIACTVRNMSAGGAELKVPPEARVPESFLLYVSVDGIAYRCRLEWRTGGRVGISFHGTEPKPHWHYG